MKKMVVMAIAVLFLPVGFRYASAASAQNYAGPLTALSLAVTFEEETGYESKTLSEGKKLVTVVPGIEGKVSGKFKYEPVLYFYFDTNGNLQYIIISWLNPPGTSYPEPNPGVSGTRIVPISCGSGNVDAPKYGTRGTSGENQTPGGWGTGGGFVPTSAGSHMFGPASPPIAPYPT